MNLLLWIVTALYFGQAVVYGWNKNYPMLMILGGYTCANLGLIWSTK